jgi:hypothetical protein
LRDFNRKWEGILARLSDIIRAVCDLVLEEADLLKIEPVLESIGVIVRPEGSAVFIFNHDLLEAVELDL